MKCEGKRPGNTSTWNRRTLRTQKSKVKFTACFHSRGSDKKTGTETYFASKFVARHTSVFTSIRPGHLPWKSHDAPILVKGKKWQVHLMVRLVINPVDEFASTMENLSTLLCICRLPCRATRSTITRCYYHPGQFWLWDTKIVSSFLRMEPCTFTLRQIMEMGWSPKALHTKVASCFTIAVRLWEPTYHECCQVVLEVWSTKVAEYLEVDRDLDIKEDGFAHFTNSVLYLAP